MDFSTPAYNFEAAIPSIRIIEPTIQSIPAKKIWDMSL
jgi:hypothetical protein